METFLLTAIVLFGAGFTQGLSGFGSVLLALPLLTLFLGIKSVVPLVAMAGLAMSLMLLLQLRRHLEWGRIRPLLLGTIPGIPAGILLLKKLDPGMMQWTLGAVLVAYGLYGLLAGGRTQGIGDLWAYPFGFLAGCFGGAFGASGPPVIVYTSMKPWDKDTIKGTLQGFFTANGALVVLSHGLSGLATPEVLRLFAVGLIPTLAGTLAGSYFYGKLGTETYKKIILGLLVLLGLFMAYRASGGS